MSEQPGHQPPDPGRRPSRKSRRERIREEIEANRRGDYVVPTWVLVLALVVVVGGLALLVILSR